MAVQIGVILLESNLTGDGSERMKMYNPLTQQSTSGNQSDRNNPTEKSVLHGDNYFSIIYNGKN